MKIKKLSLIALSTVFFLASCGETPKETTTETEPAQEQLHDAGDQHTDHEEHDHSEMEGKAEEASTLPVPEGAKVFFANLENGQTLSSPVKIEFGVEGMEVEPAGKANENKGHHHVIIDGGALESGTVVPTDEKNIHFGKGQTETELELSKGEHTLTLQFADGYHRSYGEQMSSTITVTVE